jgi:hypothetical protein
VSFEGEAHATAEGLLAGVVAKHGSPADVAKVNKNRV